MRVDCAQTEDLFDLFRRYGRRRIWLDCERNSEKISQPFPPLTKEVCYVKVCMKKSRFRPISRFISKTVQYFATVTMEDEQDLACDLSTVGSSNYLESYRDFKVTTFFNVK